MQKIKNTMKDFKDYIGLYLGCEVVATGKKPGVKHYTLVGVSMGGGCLFKTIPEGFSIDLGNDWKPLLRPLSSMTEDERVEADNARGEGDGRDNAVPEAYEFKYLLSKGFDLFGLIDAGLAIDKTPNDAVK